MTKTKQRYSLFTNRALFFLILPIIAESALTMSLGLVDSFMTKDIANGDGMAAITNIDLLSNLIIQLFSAFGTGGAIITSQFLGAGDIKNANKSAKQLYVIMFLSSIVIGIACLIFNHGIVNLFFGGQSAQNKEYSYVYFYMMAASYPFLSIFYASASLLRAQRKSMNTMTSALISFLLNVSLNALFIFGLKLEIFGAALATFLSRIFPAVFLTCLLAKKDNVVKIKVFEKFRFDGKIVGKILAVAIPSGIESCLFQLGKIMTASFISNACYIQYIDGNPLNTAKGNVLNTQTVANSCVMHINTMGSIVGNGIQTGAITVIGQAVGTGDYDCTKYYIKKIIGLGYIGNTLCVALFWALSPLLISVLMSTNAMAEAITKICMNCLNLCFAVQLFTYPLSFCAPAVLKATSDVKYVMGSAITSMALMRVGLCWLLSTPLFPMQLGALALWIGMCADWTLRGTLFGLRILSGKWKKASGRFVDAPSLHTEEKPVEEISE